MVELLDGSAPGSSASELVLYAKSASGNSELFLQRDAVFTEYQLTGPISVAANGTMFLPGGLILNYGTCTPNGLGVVSYSTLSPALANFPSTCFCVLLTPRTSNLSAQVINTTNAGFQIVASSTASYYFIALGN